MTPQELIRLRDAINPVGSERAIAVPEAAEAKMRAEAAGQARRAALARVQAARTRSAELIALRDQIPGVQTEAQAAETAPRCIAG